MTEKGKKVFHKRKKLNLKVQQELQVWLLVRIMATVLLTIAVASVILYFYSVTVVDTEYLSFAPKVRKVSEVLLPVLLAAALSSIIAGLLLALFLPLKIAGPIYRVEQDLKQIGTGDLTKVINLRNDDILKALAQAVNTAVSDIRTRVNDTKKINTDLEAEISKGDIAAIKKVFENQKESLAKIIT